MLYVATYIPEKTQKIDKVVEFANKTFGDIEVRKFFIAMMNLMFKTERGFKPKYQMTRENFCEYLLFVQTKERKRANDKEE